jgi:hypothetical protein
LGKVARSRARPRRSRPGSRHPRGCGAIEDRIDIVYEVRDATDLAFDPRRDAWWECLPQAGSAAWAERAKRRRGRKDFRLAFIPSKFRIGKEPDPFAVEIKLDKEPWSLEDVTEETEAAFEEAKGEAGRERERKIRRASLQLERAVEEAYSRPPRISRTQAEEILMAAGLTRAVARSTLDKSIGTIFETRIGRAARKGGRQPVIIIPKDRPKGGFSGRSSSGECSLRGNPLR